MKTHLSGARHASIAAAAMLVALALPAHAQGVPGGSYLQSCTNPAELHQSCRAAPMCIFSAIG
jgi:hypothetical protein